ncbi:MAG TPA: N-6 DNA methylase [Solirubrobacteraceae bacterium]|nr:N-6 DNA methylase [Solirubrobacteraceae bacterium]
MFLPATTPEAELERLNPRERRYEIGQFFTPAPIAELLADAVRDIQPETVLDPGVGGGVLLRAVGEGPRLFGLDIDPAAVEIAVASTPGEHEIALGDFLDAERWPLTAATFDAVIANPPYVRHHNLSREHKLLARHYSTQLSLKVSSLSGSYVYFFLETLLRLNDGGRLAFVTPTEFLDVRYGQAVKEALLEHCEIDEIIVMEMDELAFEGVLTTSTITIATKRRSPHRRVRLVEGRLNGAVEKRREIELPAGTAPAALPWTPLLPSRAERIAPLLRGRTAKLGDYCRVRRGIATGDNSFFVLTRADVEQWQIEDEFLVPVVLGSKDLPHEGPLDAEFHATRIAEGARSFLFFCHRRIEEIRGTNALRYIELGLELGLHERFNCRARKPWYGVERVPPADFFTTYMSRNRARMTRNLIGARCMTSLLNVWALPGVDPEALRVSLEDPTNAQLLREFGRTYGGGLAKIEPGDLISLPIRPPAGTKPPDKP